MFFVTSLFCDQTVHTGQDKNAVEKLFFCIFILKICTLNAVFHFEEPGRVVMRTLSS